MRTLTFVPWLSNSNKRADLFQVLYNRNDQYAVEKKLIDSKIASIYSADWILIETRQENICFETRWLVPYNQQTTKVQVRQDGLEDFGDLYILEVFENASQCFALFLRTVNAIEKLLAGFNVQPRIDMNQSLIWLHYNMPLLMTSHRYIQHRAPFCKFSWSFFWLFSVFKLWRVWYHNQQFIVFF